MFQHEELSEKLMCGVGLRWIQNISITKLGVVNSICTIFAYNILAADRSLWQTSKHPLALHVKSRYSRRDIKDLQIGLRVRD